MSAPSPLAAGFAHYSEDDWRALVAAGSRSVDDLATLSDDGIAVGPIYRRSEQAQPIWSRPGGRRWRIVERIAGGDPDVVARRAAEAMAGGADGIAAVFATSPHPLAGTLAVADGAALAHALAAGVTADGYLAVDAGEATVKLASAFGETAVGNGCRLVLAYDPIATVAARGGDPEAAAVEIGAVAKSFEKQCVDAIVAIADGRLWHAGGASEVQELAACLATFAWLLRRLADNDLSLDRAAIRIGVALAADADQFLTIAKVRAMRLLLGRLFEIAAISAPAPPLHAETAWRTVSRRDLYSNLLRTTAAAFAAAVGGADAITVLPFDALVGGDDLGRRLARNTQTILAEESHLHRVADPAAGSGAVEALTLALAETAWRRFQTIEVAGGAGAAVNDGTLQADIAAVRDARLRRVCDGEATMIGVNAYVDGGASEATAIAQARGPGVLSFIRLSQTFESAEDRG